MNLIEMGLGLLAWQSSDERCKNPHLNFEYGDEYLKICGYNRERQQELEIMRITNTTEFSSLLGRPIKYCKKNPLQYRRLEVEEILKGEGYKYLDLSEAFRDPEYRRLIKMAHYNGAKPDKKLLPVEQERKYMLLKQEKDRVALLGTLFLVVGILVCIGIIWGVYNICSIFLTYKNIGLMTFFSVISVPIGLIAGIIVAAWLASKYF